MHVQNQRRTRKDRRTFAVFYRYGNERRNNTGNRRLETAEELRPFFTEGTSQGYVGASDRATEIIKEVADAFGVQADSLELVEYDDLLENVEPSRSCDAARRNEELEAELAESRKDAERYRNQVKDLLRAGHGRLQ